MARVPSLSAGEKQLISFFARTIPIVPPRILILMKATANIDNRTEGKIQKVWPIC